MGGRDEARRDMQLVQEEYSTFAFLVGSMGRSIWQAGNTVPPLPPSLFFHLFQQEEDIAQQQGEHAWRQ